MADRFDIEEGQEVVRNTIVGGRPRARRKRKIAIPIGLEKVLTRAAGDPAFRRRLFESRQAALASVGWELSPSEAVILGAVPDPVLDAMIGRIDLKQHAKRRFMKGIATAVFATAAMTAAGCKGTEDTPEVFHDLGIGPDTVEVDQGNFDEGIRPDVTNDLPIAGVDIQPPDEVTLDFGPYHGDAPDDPTVPDVGEINEVEVDQGQNDGGVRPDTDTTNE